MWESAYRTGEARGHVPPHTLQNYGFASAWAGEHEATVHLLERFEAMSKDELGEQAFNVETPLVLELRLVGRLEDAEAHARASILRILGKRAHRQRMGIIKDESGPWRLQARATAALALCQSHRSMQEAAKLMHSAISMRPDDQMTMDMSPDFETMHNELNRFNLEWTAMQQIERRNNATTQTTGESEENISRLDALPYLFRGYENLQGNQPLLARNTSRMGEMIEDLMQSGLGERALIGGGASGSPRVLLRALCRKTGLCHKD